VERHPALFRERLLARLVLAHAISPELVQKLLAWNVDPPRRSPEDDHFC
jgi:hypothetical protein